MSAEHHTHHQGALGYPSPLPPLPDPALEAEVVHARAYAGPEAAADAEARLRWYAEAWGCPNRETTCSLARQAAELAAGRVAS